MGGFFNMDNGFFTTLGKIVDIIAISLIWVLLCIPIITIGPATTALYYTIVKVIRRERGYLLREFFTSFKSNFKIGATIGIILSILFLILYFDKKFAINYAGTKGFLLLGIFNAMMFLLLCVSVYIFPLLSRFNMGKKQLMKTALFMSMKHFPTTILLVFIVGACSIGTYIVLISFLIMPGICCLLCSFPLERVFKKYMPEKSEGDDITGADEWYLE